MCIISDRMLASADLPATVSTSKTPPPKSPSSNDASLEFEKYKIKAIIR